MFVFGGVASATFAAGGPGFAIVQLLVIAAFGSLVGYILSALGQGQISNMTKLLTVFACIGIVIAQVMKAIGAVAGAFGVGL
jgi:hypothetical protein